MNSSEHTFVQFYFNLRHVCLVFVLKQQLEIFYDLQFPCVCCSLSVREYSFTLLIKKYIICRLEFEIQMCNLQGPPFSPSDKGNTK